VTSVTTINAEHAKNAETKSFNTEDTEQTEDTDFRNERPRRVAAILFRSALPTVGRASACSANFCVDRDLLMSWVS